MGWITNNWLDLQNDFSYHRCRNRGGQAIFYPRDFIKIHTCSTNHCNRSVYHVCPPPNPKWNCFLHLYGYGLNKIENCCTCKLHVLSVEILTYIFLYIYSCSSNTYPIILLLEVCISQIYVLGYILPDLGCCCLHLSLQAKIDNLPVFGLVL